MDSPAPAPSMESRILFLHGPKVWLDSDRAPLSPVTTGNRNKAVPRNRDRFPDDLLFQLTAEETEALRFPWGRANASGRGGRRFHPYVFTEQGIAMLSGVLTRPRAVPVNVALMRTFVRLRHLLATHEEWAQRLDELERKPIGQDLQLDEHGRQIEAVFATREKRLTPLEENRTPRRMGFPTGEETHDI